MIRTWIWLLLLSMKIGFVAGRAYQAERCS